jgi:hypothetical protein
MKKTLAFVLSFLLFLNISAQQTVRLYGKVTDFNSIPIDSVSVRLKNDKFYNLFETLSDRDGNFSMDVPKGEYFCLYAIKSSDYGRTKLEYWAWNIPLFQDLNINPQYERMEIYGINAFEPKVTPYETYMLYFRPMSLTKSLRITNEENKKKIEQKANLNHDTINISPRNIMPEELIIKINENETQILNIQKTIEYARGAYLYGYLIQILKPNVAVDQSEKYDKISIILHSTETNETGKGEIFVQKRGK